MSLYVKDFNKISTTKKDVLDDQVNIAHRFYDRLKLGELTRDENPQDHLCVYFAAFDPEEKEIYFGHHKQSNIWMFNGGHIDKGETPGNALEREILEEWGIEMTADDIGGTPLLTITDIENPTKQTCALHYDIWYFVPVRKADFNPDEELLTEEFHQIGWMPVTQVNELDTNSNNLLAVEKIKEMFVK